jgi:hypothetical protein
MRVWHARHMPRRTRSACLAADANRSRRPAGGGVQEDMAELHAQLAFYKGRVEEMQREHKVPARPGAAPRGRTPAVA